MKKTIKSLLAIAVAAFAFTACSDVPEPYTIPTQAGSTDAGGEAVGDGTIASPFNIAAAIAKCKEIGSTESTEKYYVEGTVVSEGVADATYGNATFKMADSAEETNSSAIFTAYQVLGSDGQKMTAGYTIPVGAKVVVYGPIYNYNSKTPETAGKGAAYIYSINGKKTDGSDVTPPAEGVEAAGTGTADDPFNVAAAIKKCQEIGQEVPADKYYVRGIATEDATADATYSNASFYIVDKEDAAEKFYCFQVALPVASPIKKGDIVVIYGPIYNYKGNTPETAGKSAASVVSINGQAVGEGGGGSEPTAGTPSGDGTLASPFNVAAAVAKCKEAGTTATTEKYYVKGIVDAAYTVDSYKNATFKMVDAEGATEKFTAYRVKGTDGKDLKVGYIIPKGAEVIVYGQLVNYQGNTPETAQNSGNIVSVNGQPTEEATDEGGETGGDNTGGEVSGNSITAVFSSFGFTNAQDLTTATVTLSDGTTLTFSAGENKTTPKYYDAGSNIRLYPKNTMTINAGSKKIAAIEVSCDTYNGTLCNAGGEVTIDGNMMTVDGSQLKYTGPNASTATLANGSTQTSTPSQIRMTQLKITYAE